MDCSFPELPRATSAWGLVECTWDAECYAAGTRRGVAATHFTDLACIASAFNTDSGRGWHPA